MLTPFYLRILHSVSLSPAEFAIVKSTFFSNTAEENIMAGFIFVLFLLCYLPRRFYLISIHDTRTHHYTFIKSSMLRKYLKNESIGRWLPDVHHYTSRCNICLFHHILFYFKMLKKIYTTVRSCTSSIAVLLDSSYDSCRTSYFLFSPNLSNLPNFLRSLFLPLVAPPFFYSRPDYEPAALSTTN